MQNRMELHFSSCPQNESFARVAIAAFAVQLNPTLPEMADIKTAVSEAVTNAIVHGYRDQEGMVSLCAEYGDRRLLTVRVHDDGCGIEDVPAAMQPFYSTGDGNERSGIIDAISNKHNSSMFASLFLKFGKFFIRKKS